MKKRTVLLISLVAVAGFAGLVYYGWSNRWGAPMTRGLQKAPVVKVPQLDRSVDLEPSAFTDGLWTELQPTTVELIHQLTWKPWGDSLIPEMQVRAFHNGEDVYFLLEWEDDAETLEHGVNQFPDAAAVGFPLSDEPPGTSLMMGFLTPLDIWEWKANLDADYWGRPDRKERFTSNVQYTYEEKANFPQRKKKVTSACQSLVASRPGSLTKKKNNGISGRGRWKEGRWRMIIRRPLTTERKEKDVQLTLQRKHAAFALWDGDAEDRGSRKSISDWVLLHFEGLGTQRGGPSARRVQPVGGVSFARAPRRWVAETEKKEERPEGPLQRLLSFSILPSAEAAETTGPPAQPDHRVIRVEAERFYYTPGEITVQKGQKVTIKLVSLDVTHGLYLDGYELRTQATPAKQGEFTFVADKTGRFTFRCSETCGPFHPYMVGYLTVEPNNRFHIYLGAVVVAFIGISAFVMTRGSGRKVTLDNE